MDTDKDGMSSTIPLHPREQLCNKYCSNNNNNDDDDDDDNNNSGSLWEMYFP